MATLKSDYLALQNGLAEANRLLNLAEQIAHVGHWRLSLPDWRRSWSAETFRIFGADPADGEPGIDEAFNGYVAEDQERVRAILAAAIREQKDCTFDARVLHRDGEIRDVQVRCICEVKDGRPEALFGVIIDMTDHKRAEARVRDGEARYRLLAEHTTDLIIQADMSSKRLYVSPASRRLLGYEPEELIGTLAHEILHPDDVGAFRTFLETLRDVGPERAVTRQRYRHKCGRYLMAETTYSLICDPATGMPTGYIAAVRDISERHAAEMRAVHAARHDFLTGLANRKLFRERLDQALHLAQAGGTQFLLLWIDLDRFKSINDTFGHPAGDSLLREVGQRITAVVSPSATVARISGDEFAVLETGIHETRDARILARRLISAIDRPWRLEAHSINVGASIGMTFGPKHGTSADALSKNIDLALYAAKARGRNTYRFFSPHMYAAQQDKLALQLDLRDAIAAGDFTLHYQPIIDVDTGKITASEALLRWQHPTRGPIAPNVFIPIAEESGLIVPLGSWALKEACRQAASWPIRIQIAVNVSVCQIKRVGFELHVIAALAASGLAASRLELEITESVLIDDTEAVLERLHHLRAIGVKTALDDFGTGYSSLRYINQFPFDKIKIDQSFVRAIDEGGSAGAIVSLIADLGRRLGIVITAEGVETQANLDQVRAAGCGQYQGFYFSAAVDASALRDMLLTQQRENAIPFGAEA